MPKQYEIDAAYYQGLREGFDPEVAEDLGIPTTPESVTVHTASAQKVAELTGSLVIEETTQIDNGRQEWIDSMHLTRPSASGPLLRATPEQRSSTSAAVMRQKEFIVPMRDSKE